MRRGVAGRFCENVTDQLLFHLRVCMATGAWFALHTSLLVIVPGLWILRIVGGCMATGAWCALHTSLLVIVPGLWILRIVGRWLITKIWSFWSVAGVILVCFGIVEECRFFFCFMTAATVAGADFTAVFFLRLLMWARAEQNYLPEESLNLGWTWYKLVEKHSQISKQLNKDSADTHFSLVKKATVWNVCCLCQ